MNLDHVVGSRYALRQQRNAAFPQGGDEILRTQLQDTCDERDQYVELTRVLEIRAAGVVQLNDATAFNHLVSSMDNYLHLALNMWRPQ
ncbi:hypothetical protein DXG01_008896 [Tephrocybe rancida]|nr:hypothetical protein DXG01_008896 [Tephrocybe rancida]